ncbi:Diacylglycerol O-acyltransferase 2 [Chamberlinius hualienensis]
MTNSPNSFVLGNCATTKKSIEYIFTKQGTGNAVVNVVGGAAEIPYTRPYHMILVLKNRKGFVEMAIKYGADLLPILNFGEGEMYSPAWKPKIDGLENFEIKFKSYTGFRPALYALYNFLVNVVVVGIPNRTPMTSVVGRPIEVIKDPNPSKELIDKYHMKYIEAVQQLYEESKSKLGPEYKNAKLTII